MAQKFYLGPWQQELVVPDPLDPSVSWVRWIPPPGAGCVLDLRSLPAHATAGIALFSTDGTLGSDYHLIDQNAPGEKALVASMLGVPSLRGTTLIDWMWDVLTLRADPTGLNSAKPLMPEGLTLVLHAGDVRRSRPFTLDIPEAANVIAVMKEEYRSLRQRAQAGLLIGPDGPDPEFHRRVLDAWGEQFRLPNPEDVFIPAGVPKETRLPHRTTYSESFNKADAGTFGPDLTWYEAWGSAWGVTSNKGTIQANGALAIYRAQHDTSTSNQFAQCVLNLGTNLSEGAVVLRMVAFDNAGYVWQGMVSADPNHRWLKRVSDTETLLGTQADDDPATDEVLRGTVSGSTLSGYKNGSLIKTRTDTAITSGTRAGLRGYRSADSGQFVTVDDFSYGDFVPSSISAVLRMLI